MIGNQYFASPLLEIRSPCLSYSNVPSVSDSYRIWPGEHHLILSSASLLKTRLAMAIAASQNSNEGFTIPDWNILFEGKPITCFSKTEITNQVALLFPESSHMFVTLKVGDELAFGLENIGMEPKLILDKIAMVASQLKIDDLLEKYLNKLSGGQAQKVAFGAMLASGPKLLILDEPFTNLDPESHKELRNLLDRNKSKQQLSTLTLSSRMYEDDRDFESVALLHENRLSKQFSPQDFVKVLGEKAIYETQVQLPGRSELFIALRNRYKEKAVSIPFPDENWLPRISVSSKHRCIDDSVSRETIIELRNVSFSYPNSFQALTNISLQLGKGLIVGVVGRNGSGKTTLARVIAGLETPQEGEIVIDGLPQRSYSRRELSRTVTLVFQDPIDQILAETVFEEIEISIPDTKRDRKYVHTILEAIGLSSKEKLHPIELSFAEQRCLGLGIAMAVQAKVVIVDEPTFSQDRVGKKLIANIIKSLKAQGTLVIVITHDMDFVYQETDQVLVVGSGILRFFGKPQDLFENEKLLSANRLSKPEVIELEKICSVEAGTWAGLDIEKIAHQLNF